MTYSIISEHGNEISSGFQSIQQADAAARRWLRNNAPEDCTCVEVCNEDGNEVRVIDAKNA